VGRETLAQRRRRVMRRLKVDANPSTHRHAISQIPLH